MPGQPLMGILARSTWRHLAPKMVRSARIWLSITAQVGHLLRHRQLPKFHSYADREPDAKSDSGLTAASDTRSSRPTPNSVARDGDILRGRSLLRGANHRGQR